MHTDILVFNSLFEIQIKFKILYLYSDFPKENEFLIQRVRPTMIRIFLKILSLLEMKEVFTGKFKNRLFSNYFKSVNSEYAKLSILENNILLLDSTYSSTMAISDIYRIFTKK